ncbi:MAG: type II secretion system GspH family protein [Azonexus sp.]|nr:type II secretion system protein [Azonexus sp.]MCK6411083.1 type II secretion system GspH family protein [Azonexus sp.]
MRQRGFTLLELVLVIVIFGLLLGVYLRSVRYYQEMAEQATVSLTLSNIRTGMAHEWVDRIVQGKAGEKIDQLIGSNPVRWLENPPPAYYGEIKAPNPERMETASWYFDLSQKELVYVVNNGSELEVENMSGRKVLRWKVALEDNSGSTSAVFGNLVLQPVVKYRWF